jgi:putative ABC transport system substrate-binding protein
MRRREFLGVLGSAAAVWPLAARAQQPTMPIIGVLSGGTRDKENDKLAAFVTGLRQTRFVEGQNLAIEYRFANNRFERLSSLAADLVRSNVTVIFVIAGTIGALAAKAATQTIPIVFVTGGDPIKAGLVASLNQPGGNITGISLIAGALNEKRLELLHEVTPKATLIATLYNPSNPNHEPEVRRLEAASRALNLQMKAYEASNAREIDASFTALTADRVGGLNVLTDPFLNDRIDQLVTLSARYAVPTVYGYREFAAAGGLMSYGTNSREARRQAGLLVARILQGERPANLPVQQSTRVELSINLRTAKVLGITFPLSLLGRADEVIE